MKEYGDRFCSAHSTRPTQMNVHMIIKHSKLSLDHEGLGHEGKYSNIPNRGFLTDHSEPLRLVFDMPL